MPLPASTSAALADTDPAGPRLERRAEAREEPRERKAPWWTALITPAWMVGAALLATVTDHAVGPLTARIERIEAHEASMDAHLARIDARQDASLNDRIDLRRLLYAELRGQCVVLTASQLAASALPCDEARADGRYLDLHARGMRAPGEPNQ